MFTKCLKASTFLFILEESIIDKHAIVKCLAFQPGLPVALRVQYPVRYIWVKTRLLTLGTVYLYELENHVNAVLVPV